MWVRNQRNSWHGVDFPYHSALDIAEYYRRYAETLLAVDDSVGRVMALLRERGLLDSTIVMFMGDNGFAFGEHGLIDKRTAYEAVDARAAADVRRRLAGGATRVEDVVANIDIAPTILDAAGLQPPPMDGRSALPLARGERIPWRETLLYEYYWERNFPQTPTMHALRGSRYKYIRYYGLWDTDELYDLQADPLETRNLIRDPVASRHRDEAQRRAVQDASGDRRHVHSAGARRAADPQNLRRRDGSKARTSRRLFPPPSLYAAA